MELFRRIRIKTGMSLLEGKLKYLERKRAFPGLSSIRSVGIVWDASRTDDFPILTAFHQKMHEKNIEVKILGYFPAKKLPDKYTAIRYLTCLKEKDIDFFYRPKSPEVALFINTRFDVLIDINFNKLFPLVYISSLSVASLKTGLTNDNPEKSPFDLMIDLKKNTGIENFLNQIMHYIGMLSSRTVKTAI